jgi:hypothetical protein
MVSCHSLKPTQSIFIPRHFGVSLIASRPLRVLKVIKREAQCASQQVTTALVGTMASSERAAQERRVAPREGHAARQHAASRPWNLACAHPSHYRRWCRLKCNGVRARARGGCRATSVDAGVRGLTPEQMLLAATGHGRQTAPSMPSERASRSEASRGRGCRRSHASSPSGTSGRRQANRRPWVAAGRG